MRYTLSKIQELNKNNIVAQQLSKHRKQQAVLGDLQKKLVEALAAYEAETAAYRDALTDGQERYLRILTLIIKSLETLSRLDKNIGSTDMEEEHRQRVQQLEDLQCRLARIAAARSADGVSSQSDE